MQSTNWGVRRDTSPEAYRLEQRQVAFDFRRMRANRVLCDCCQARDATDYHEIINRNRTQNAPPAIQCLTYRAELCSCLCEACHQDIAPTNAGRKLLLLHNVHLFGLERVQSAFEAVPELYRDNIPFPTESFSDALH